MSGVPPAEEADAYFTLAVPAEAEIKILGSRFLGFAYPVHTNSDFMEHLQALKKRYYAATHHCFAYRIGFDGAEFRYSDDGEPSGTAGKRILGSIDRVRLTDTGIAVVRYFGGTKLGAGGLGHAYSDSADAVIEAATIVRRYLKKRFRIRFPYDATKSVHHDIDIYEAEVTGRQYGEDVMYDVSLRQSRIEDFKRDVTEHTQRTAAFMDDEDSTA